jgi:DNA segregation ATPase FtsK/SpoIIIE, S-DNA-T family
MPIALAQRNPAVPLPEKIAALVHEVRWLLVAALGIYLAMIFWGFTPADPGWSHSAATDRLANPGGRFGAWLADLLLYLFGVSAWWWIGLLFFLVGWGYRRVNTLFGGDRRPLTIALVGFVMLLLASCSIEAMRFWSMKATLPLAPGGMIGIEVGRLTTRVLGYTGGTLLMLSLFLAGLTLFLGISWINVAERTGALLEEAWFAGIQFWQRWQDRRYGRTVAERREATVEDVRRKIEVTPPVRIEPVDLEIPRAAKAEVRAAVAPARRTEPQAGRPAGRRDAGVHLTADRAQTRRLRRGGQGAFRLAGSGGYAL